MLIHRYRPRSNNCITVLLGISILASISNFVRSADENISAMVQDLLVFCEFHTSIAPSALSAPAVK